MTVCLVMIGLALSCRQPSPVADPPRLEDAGATALVRAVALTQDPAADRGRPEDDWFAEDKLRHLGLSFAITAMSYAGARITLAPDASMAAAGALGVAAGVGKEWHDRGATGLFSVRDLVWDAAGIAAGLLLANEIR